MSFGFFSPPEDSEEEEKLVADPSLKEELVMDGRITLTLNPHQELCGCQKSGGAPIPSAQMVRCAHLAAIKVEELLRARADGEAQRLSLERLAQQQRHVERDRDDPRDEIAQALASAQEDLHAKTEEARHLSSKVARLEAAISQIM